ncbi:mannosyltransferase family protein [Actinocrispum sp. NPDC049592]|uniref:mannosyltransferase family protein n=1 Tax=Actinocrispum sp. NPDC049592 TaxID=3154835 RepID=UPI0034437E3B
MTDQIVRPSVRLQADPAPETRPPQGRGRRLLHSDWARTFAVVLLFHGALTVLAVLFQGTLPEFHRDPNELSGLRPQLLLHTFRWDSVHYNGILNGRYTDPATPWTAAFYPVFPLAVGLVQTITFGKLGVLASGLIVNFTATWLAATALLRIARHFVRAPWAPWLAVSAFLTAPTAYFLHSFYSEATFCAIAFWAYLFALRRKWAWMGLCLIVATTTRLPSALFVLLCLLEFCRAHDWQPRRLLSWNLLWFPAAYIGFGCYALYLKLAVGDGLAMFHAYQYDEWPYQVTNPNIPQTIARELRTSATAVINAPVGNWALISHVIPIVGLGILLLAAWWMLRAHRGAGVPLAIFGIAAMVMFTLNSNVVSVHRFLLPCIVIYLAMATAAERGPRLRAAMGGLMATHTLLMAFLYCLFIMGIWSG